MRRCLVKITIFELLLKKIDQSINIAGLYEAVKEATTFLGIENIPDTQRLITYQGFAKGHVQKKLSQLVLSVDLKGVTEKFDSKNRAFLSAILEMAWITDPDEVNYYLQEFDLHTVTQGKSKEPEEVPSLEIQEIPNPVVAVVDSVKTEEHQEESALPSPEPTLFQLGKPMPRP